MVRAGAPTGPAARSPADPGARKPPGYAGCGSGEVALEGPKEGRNPVA
jgi:hypothetical protein